MEYRPSPQGPKVLCRPAPPYAQRKFDLPVLSINIALIAAALLFGSLRSRWNAGCPKAQVGLSSCSHNGIGVGPTYNLYNQLWIIGLVWIEGCIARTKLKRFVKIQNWKLIKKCDLCTGPEEHCLIIMVSMTNYSSIALTECDTCQTFLCTMGEYTCILGILGMHTMGEYWRQMCDVCYSLYTWSSSRSMPGLLMWPHIL